MNLTKEPPMKFALERHATVTALALAVSALPVLAGDGKHEARVPLLPLYQQECAACHVAYPPRLLPGPSWQRLMSGLPKHFGSDASLDAAATTQIANWLAANAGTSRRAAEEPPQDRITRSAWFEHEHGDIAAITWNSPRVKGRANCAACHTRANEGVFNEHEIRIPR
jgi:mono/diheme cytochrome c family protein